jgi:hypothetical protein
MRVEIPALHDPNRLLGDPRLVEMIGIRQASIDPMNANHHAHGEEDHEQEDEPP